MKFGKIMQVFKYSIMHITMSYGVSTKLILFKGLEYKFLSGKYTA